MNPADDSQHRTIKAKKSSSAQPPALANPGPSGPTTFFLRSEKEVEKSSQRGRRRSRGSSSVQEDSMEKTPMASIMGDSSFGVQSLEDTIGTSFSSDNTLSRTQSNTSEASVEAGAEGSVLAGRKRKAGNPVHPKIAATGQRIISADHLASGTGSPMSYRSAESPIRSQRRRGSVASSINMSQPLTPLRMSPKPESAMPSTPRSGSPKSFRLSDEEVSVASDTGSQAIQSSSGDDDDSASVDHSKGQAMPQLVMPSITMPARRPFTERGRRMGRLKLMVVGPRGVGKTSLIQAVCRACEDIVHVDPVPLDGTVEDIREIGASTRPFPNWWTDFESRRMLHHRKSVGDGVLERNIMFIDTLGFQDGKQVQEVLSYFHSSLSRTAAMERMNDIELISMLSGEGGVHIDAVLYLFDTTGSVADLNSVPETYKKQLELLRYLCKWTNVIPLMAKADTVDKDELVSKKTSVLEMFKKLELEPYTFIPARKLEEEAPAEEVFEPFAVSSAIGDDSETIDASILMSSTYLQPLIPSELNLLLSHLLEPESIARVRHLSATKFLLWRQENLGNHIDLQKQLLLKSPRLETSSQAATSTGSIPDEPTKGLVAHSSAGYYRSTSPSLSDHSAVSGGNVIGTTSYALARYNDTKSPIEPFRQVRLAKWAQDLQRSLDNERKRYKRMYTNQPADWVSNAGESEKASDANQALVPTSQHRPGKGRLGGEVGIIDPRDPLGVLAFGQTFRRQGWFALQLAGSCGLIGAVAWWVMRNWAEVQEFLGLGQPGPVVTVTGVPAPTRGAFDTCNWKGWFGREGSGWGR